MSALIVIRALLQASAQVTGLVADRIHVWPLPEGTALPAVALRSISRTQRDAVGMRLVQSTVLVTERVQITAFVHSDTGYAQLAALVDAAHTACANRIAADIGGVPQVTTRAAGWGPDLRDPDSGFAQRSVDIIVSYRQSVGA